MSRLFGGGRPNTDAETQQPLADEPASPSEDRVPAEPMATPTAVRRGVAATCPYCATLLDPAPERGRLCPRCRRRIVVRQVDGRRVLLTEEAVKVFESERDRETREHDWTTERSRWLALAKGVAAPADRIARLIARPPSDAVVAASKDLYLAAAERAVRAARPKKRWDVVASVRRQQAAALFRASGSPIPPPDDIVALHRAGSEAMLRKHATFGTRVELVATGCCAICGRDNGRAFQIAAELKAQRLPHDGCPKGLCGCDWFPLPDAPKSRRRVRRPASSGADAAPPPAADPEAGPAEGTEPDLSPAQERVVTLGEA